MSTSSARLIQLLELLQSRRAWTGGELATRLGVSARTVRTNVAQLRDLGIPVVASPGRAGGYELGAGSRMAPVLFADDEAIATAVGLATAAGTGIADVEGAAVRALAKLRQVLPDRLQRRVDALEGSIEPLRWSPERTTISAEALTVFSQACRDRVQVRFDYLDREGQATQRTVEPHTLVPDGRRWYLVAFDLDRDDWRTFRVDRTTRQRTARRRSAARDLPAADAATYVRQSITHSRPRHQAKLVLQVGIELAAERLGSRLGTLTPLDDDRCRLDAEVEHLDWLAMHLTLHEIDFIVIEPAELRERLTLLAARLNRAAVTPEGCADGG